MKAVDVFASSQSNVTATPIWLVEEGSRVDIEKRLSELLDKEQMQWVSATGFRAKAGNYLLVPGGNGSIAGILLGIGSGDFRQPCGSIELCVGQLSKVLPNGVYEIVSKMKQPYLAALAWGLGAYRFERYKHASKTRKVKLVVPDGVDAQDVVAQVESVWLGRDLINTPACDLGPEELEAAARALGREFGAQVDTVCGEDLLVKNFPMIHAVGRASPRQPRLIDLRWSPGGGENAPSVTLVGKGICFDTGGLNLKPGTGMLLMKKDMGGAATALTLGRMIMSSRLNVRLRLLIAAAENSVSGNAFRPSDVLISRSGKTVEIGNTDAEGRLVLADALSLADEECPDILISLATLTGAARVALGPDLPAFFSTDPAFADKVRLYGEMIGDPVWQMPFWMGYDGKLDSDVADMKNVSDCPFAGAITAALFLKRFVDKSKCYAHVDLYGWSPKARALGPKGGEPMTARALFGALKERLMV